MDTWVTQFQDEFETKLSALLGKTYSDSPTATSIAPSVVEHIEAPKPVINGLAAVALPSKYGLCYLIVKSNNGSYEGLTVDGAPSLYNVVADEQGDMIRNKNDAFMPLYVNEWEEGFQELTSAVSQSASLVGEYPAVTMNVVAPQTPDVGDTATIQINGVNIETTPFANCEKAVLVGWLRVVDSIDGSWLPEQFIDAEPRSLESTGDLNDALNELDVNVPVGVVLVSGETYNKVGIITKTNDTNVLIQDIVSSQDHDLKLVEQGNPITAASYQNVSGSIASALSDIILNNDMGYDTETGVLYSDIPSFPQWYLDI